MISQAKRPLGLVVSNAIIRAFGFLLLLIGLLKVVGLLFPTESMATYLKVSNPVLPVLTNRWVFCVAAAVQCWVGYHVFRSKTSVTSRAGFLLWLGGVIFAYKLALAFVDYHGPCGCLFGLNRFLPIRTGLQKLLADFVLAAMLIASALVFVWCGWAYRSRGQEVLPEPLKEHA